MQNKFAAIAMIMVIMIGMTGLAAATTYDSSVTLENKNSSTWAVITGDGISATIDYNSVGDIFEWRASGNVPVAGADYVLIYYADEPDKFTNWGGNNPGALIGTITTDNNGDFTTGPRTVNLGMNLPCSPDANMVEYDYSGAPDFYAHAHGAKLWMVPEANYNEANKVVGWFPDRFLLETDLITYTYTGPVASQGAGIATISIGDAFVCDDGIHESIMYLPIMVSGASDVGSVDLTLTYDPSLVTVTVTNGDMEQTQPYEVTPGQINILAYQEYNPGLDGEFILANVEFTPIDDGICDLDITVTSFLDTTQRTVGMSYVVSDGSLYINAYMIGDVNYNGVVDSGDVMVLAKHLLGMTGFETINECAADIDCDSDKIDANDVAHLAKYLLGVSGYTLPAICPQ